MARESEWTKSYHSDSRSLHAGDVSITRRGSRVLVAVPYREEFRLGARGILDAKWRAAVRMWSFPMKECEEVRALIRQVFGQSAVPQWMDEWRGV